MKVVAAQLKVAELRAELCALGLPSDGLKAVLVARLEEALAAARRSDETTAGATGKPASNEAAAATEGAQARPEPAPAKPSASPAKESRKRASRGKGRDDAEGEPASHEAAAFDAAAASAQTEPAPAKPSASPAKESRKRASRGKGRDDAEGEAASHEAAAAEGAPSVDEAAAALPKPVANELSPAAERVEPLGKRKTSASEPPVHAGLADGAHATSAETASLPLLPAAAEPAREAQPVLAPASADAALAVAPFAAAPAAAHASLAAPMQLHQAGDWVVQWDPHYQHAYYCNVRTHETTWVAPPALAHPHAQPTACAPAAPAMRPHGVQQPHAKRQRGAGAQQDAQQASVYRESYAAYMARFRGEQPTAPS